MTWGSGRLGRFAKQRRPYRPHVRKGLGSDRIRITYRDKPTLVLWHFGLLRRHGEVFRKLRQRLPIDFPVQAKKAIGILLHLREKIFLNTHTRKGEQQTGGAAAAAR